jgi:hypothetical protein
VTTSHPINNARRPVSTPDHSLCNRRTRKRSRLATHETGATTHAPANRPKLGYRLHAHPPIGETWRVEPGSHQSVDRAHGRLRGGWQPRLKFSSSPNQRLHLLVDEIAMTPFSPSIGMVVSNAAERLRRFSRSWRAFEPYMRAG